MLDGHAPDCRGYDCGSEVALAIDVEHLLAENARLRMRQESHDLANETVRWKGRAAHLEATLAKVRALADEYRIARAHRSHGGLVPVKRLDAVLDRRPSGEA